MLDDTLIEQLNRGYVCPPDAGPAWRAAVESGLNMAEVEKNLFLNPEQRLEKHQRTLNQIHEREELLRILRQGLKFISNYHGHSR